MFFHLLYIHLFRPFLKYNPSTSPLPSHISPRKLCTQAAASISKLMRLYKRTYGLRQICNIAVYIVHSACTIHLLNLPEKMAKRDIIHGVKHLEEIAEDWLCARRTLSILSVLARKWKVELPDEASNVFIRTDAKYGFFSTADVPSPKAELVVQTPPSTTPSPRILQPAHQALNTVSIQNPLMKSLYSYMPESPTVPNGATNQFPQQSPPINLSRIKTCQSNGTAKINISGEPSVSPVPYPRHPYNTATRELPRSDSAIMSEATSTSNSMTRQVSPNTMFGGVDALVESQDWWLRDQASLAIGFDNWMGGNAADINNGGSRGIDGSTITDTDLINGMATEFYMPPNNGGDNGYRGVDNDWTTYN